MPLHAQIVTARSLLLQSMPTGACAAVRGYDVLAVDWP
jgi:hypothetical protein